MLPPVIEVCQIGYFGRSLFWPALLSSHTLAPMVLDVLLLVGPASNEIKRMKALQVPGFRQTFSGGVESAVAQHTLAEVRYDR